MKETRGLTIREVAKRAGVSVATVSRVINKSSLVKPETREKILAVIQDSDYVPSAVARSLSVQDTSNIAVMVPDLKNSFFATAVNGITKIAEENKFNVFLFDTGESADREERSLMTLRELRLAGLIIVPVNSYSVTTRNLLGRLKNNGVPIVVMDRDIPGGSFSKVLATNERGAYEATSRFIREGHRKIALIEGLLTATPMMERRNGYQKALLDNGIAFDPRYVAKGGMASPEDTYRALIELFALPDPPTAIFSCNNIMTLGCLKYFTDHQMVCGQDVALIGCDDIEALQMIGYHISVVQSSALDIGDAAMKLLLKRRQTGEDQTVMIPTHLVLRGTEKLNPDTTKQD